MSPRRLIGALLGMPSVSKGGFDLDEYNDGGWGTRTGGRDSLSSSIL